MSTCNTLSPIMTPEASRGAFTIIACVGRGPNADFIVPHALAVGKALGAPVTLLQVLEAQAASDARPDPIEWDMRRHEARKMLGGLATVAGNPSARADIALAEGRTVDEICRYANGKAECVIILGRGAGEDIDPRRVGSTVHNVAGRAPGSILLVPNDISTNPAPCYRRILVPVDGSAWAESVLPLAVRMAKANDAELILVHVVPTPELTEIGPLEPDDIQPYSWRELSSARCH
jgi:nucleotide-binding universal stress UspA family protein